MSSSLVDQFDTEMRMTCWPCQTAPPAQQVPSACTRAITSRSGDRRRQSSSPSPVNRTSTWFSTTSLSTRMRPAWAGGRPCAARGRTSASPSTRTPCATERADQRVERHDARPPRRFGHPVHADRAARPRRARDTTRERSWPPDAAPGGRTIAMPESYGTFSHLCASVVHESARGEALHLVRELRHGGRPQPERAVHVDPGAAGVRCVDDRARRDRWRPC